LERDGTSRGETSTVDVLGVRVAAAESRKWLGEMDAFGAHETALPVVVRDEVKVKVEVKVKM